MTYPWIEKKSAFILKFFERFIKKWKSKKFNLKTTGPLFLAKAFDTKHSHS